MTDRPAEKGDELVPKSEEVKNDEQPVHAPGIRELPLVALRETVIFPEMIVPLQVGRDKSVAALNAAMAANGPIALVTQREAEREEIEDPSELFTVGTLAKIAQVVQLQDGTVRAIVQGQGRLRVIDFVQTSPYIIVRVEELPDVTPDGIEMQALIRTVQAQIEQYVANGAPVPPEAAVAARNISEPGLLADMVAYSPDLSTEQRMQLLDLDDDVRAGLGKADHAQATLALDDRSDGPVLKLHDLGDLGERADGVELGDVLDLLALRLALSDQGDRAA